MNSKKDSKNNAEKDPKTDDTDKDESGKDKSGKDESGKDESGKDESGKDESGKDEAGTDEPEQETTTGVPDGSTDDDTTTAEEIITSTFAPDEPQNPWWDSKNGITPEKFNELVDAINKINELFGKYKI